MKVFFIFSAMVLAVPLVNASEKFESPPSFGFELSVAPTINGDDDVLSGGGLFLYQLDSKLQLGAGIKHRHHRVQSNETLSDILLRYNVYEGINWGFNLGAGLEGNDPKIAYHFSYEITPLASIVLGFNTIFDSNEKNRLEANFGFNYFFYSSPTDLTINEVLVSDDEELYSHTQKEEVIKPIASEKKSLVRVYIVEKGDWLIKISKILNTDLETLLLMNSDIENPDLIYPDQLIRYSLEER